MHNIIVHEGKVHRFAGDTTYFHSAASKVSDSYKDVVKLFNKLFSQNVGKYLLPGQDVN